MYQENVINGKRVAVISANDHQGPFSTRLYVNATMRGEIILDADATLICKKAQTIKGARKQAEAMVNY